MFYDIAYFITIFSSCRYNEKYLQVSIFFETKVIIFENQLIKKIMTFNLEKIKLRFIFIFVSGSILLSCKNEKVKSKPIIGDWQLVYNSWRDTLDQGREEFNTDPKAFKSGEKHISKDFIKIIKDIPGQKDLYGTIVKPYKFSIIEENDKLFLTDDKGKYELVLNSEDKTYNSPKFDSINKMSGIWGLVINLTPSDSLIMTLDKRKGIPVAYSVLSRGR